MPRKSESTTGIFMQRKARAETITKIRNYFDSGKSNEKKITLVWSFKTNVRYYEISKLQHIY